MIEETSAAEADDQTTQILRLVRERRTIRNFTAEAISPALITELLQTAEASITKTGAELPWRFLIASSEEGKQRAADSIMSTYTEQGLLKWIPSKINRIMADRIVKIPAILFVIRKKEINEEERVRHYADLCALLQSFSLLAWEKRLGMVWGTGEYLDKPSLHKGIALTEEEQIHCMLYLGKYDKTPKMKPRTAAARKFTTL